jgi:lipopolysaccharide assembly protein B
LPHSPVGGWVVPKRDAIFLTHPIRKSFTRGLNYLASDENDKAIELFLKLISDDAAVVETHFALAQLFMRRGEVERAIRIHQNLIDRPTLTQQQRQQALFELSRDYLRAGLLDRAEGLFKVLINDNLYGLRSRKLLLDIYQQMRDWQAAINIAMGMLNNTDADPRLHKNIAHFHCELAQTALLQGDITLARSHLNSAKAVDVTSARVAMMLAEMAIEEDRAEEAIELLLSVAHDEPGFLGETLPQLTTAWRESGRSMQNLLALVGEWIRLFPTPILSAGYTRLMQQEENSVTAIQQIQQQLINHP